MTHMNVCEPKKTKGYENLFQIKPRHGLSLFQKRILSLDRRHQGIKALQEHLSKNHQRFHFTLRRLEPERAAEFPHSSRTMLHKVNPLQKMRHCNMKHANSTVHQNPLGIQTMFAAHSGMGLHLAWLLDRRKQPQR